MDRFAPPMFSEPTGWFYCANEECPDFGMLFDPGYEDDGSGGFLAPVDTDCPECGEEGEPQP